MPLKSYQEFLSEQIYLDEESKDLNKNQTHYVKKIPLYKNELMWSGLRSMFDLNPSQQIIDQINNTIDNTVAQIEHGKNGGIGFVKIGNKIAFGEFVGENNGISRSPMTVEELNKFLKGLK